MSAVPSVPDADEQIVELQREAKELGQQAAKIADDDEATPIYKRSWAIEKEIAVMPVHTFGGITVKLKHCLELRAAGKAAHEEETIRSVLAAIERLAGGAA